MLSPPCPITDAEKREALEAVLQSVTFSRSAQLRALLKHICEKEMTGRAHELTEYEIGVEVLGRRKDSDPAEDSSVRNRAYELRQRLEKYYSTEQPHAQVRIEVPRGGYVPVYVRHTETKALEPLVEVQPIIRGTGARRRGWVVVSGVAVVALVCLAAGWFLGRSSPPNRPAPIIEEAWGPLAQPGDEMLISIATNLYLLVRPHIEAHPHRYPAPDDLYQVYGEQHPTVPGEVLFMEPALLSVPLAEATAVAALANTRAAFGGGYQILPESEAPVAALRGRNGALIGTAVNSRSAAFLLKNAPISIVFTPDDQFAVVDQRKSAGQNVLYTSQPRGDPVPSGQYGILTVLAGSDAVGHPKRTLVVSGTGSAAIQAAVEYFCSPAHLQRLKERFRAAGLPGFPAGYQVVVNCKTSGLRLISYQYATHALIEKSAEPER